jgi:hypothetical protein
MHSWRNSFALRSRIACSVGMKGPWKSVGGLPPLGLCHEPADSSRGPASSSPLLGRGGKLVVKVVFTGLVPFLGPRPLLFRRAGVAQW